MLRVEFAATASLRLEPLCAAADFSGMDAAGKDGAIRHVMSGVNPRAARSSVSNSRAPKNWNTIFSGAPRAAFPNAGGSDLQSFLLRGSAGRSRASGDSPQPGASEELRDEKTIWEERYRSIVDLERHLHRNGTRIVKIFLHLSKEEQRKRFLARIDEPDKNWKFSLADIHERKYWKDYVKAYEACLQRPAPITRPGTSFPPTIRRTPA